MVFVDTILTDQEKMVDFSETKEPNRIARRANNIAIKAYELKRHYGKHDKTLKIHALECNHCNFRAWIPRNMERHLKTEHQDVKFLAAPGEVQYTVVEGDNWVEFNERANEILANNPNCNK